MRTVEFYAVIEPHKRYGSWHPVLAAAKRKSPQLRAGQIAVRIKLELPDDWDKPTTLPLVINQNQIQRPTAQAI